MIIPFERLEAMIADMKERGATAVNLRYMPIPKDAQYHAKGYFKGQNGWDDTKGVYEIKFKEDSCQITRVDTEVIRKEL